MSTPKSLNEDELWDVEAARKNAEKTARRNSPEEKLVPLPDLAGPNETAQYGAIRLEYATRALGSDCSGTRNQVPEKVAPAERVVTPAADGKLPSNGEDGFSDPQIAWLDERSRAAVTHEQLFQEVSPAQPIKADALTPPSLAHVEAPPEAPAEKRSWVARLFLRSRFTRWLLNIFAHV